VRQGLFREDLFHRLNVIRLRLPPLRERREDIPMLARHFLARSARELGVEPKRLTPEALQLICALPFPGNVRQLENLCHWLTVLAPAQWVRVDDLPIELRQESMPELGAAGAPGAAAAASGPVPEAGAGQAKPAEDWRGSLAREVQRRLSGGDEAIMDSLTRDFEATVIRTALGHTHGRRIEAAGRLGLGRNTITRKIQDLHLED
jgi:two-component system nitrogen regulation response regulator GlnG